MTQSNKTNFAHSISNSITNTNTTNTISNTVTFFGLTFEFIEASYRLHTRSYSIPEIFEICASIKDFYGVAVQKGYVPQNQIPNPMLANITKHLTSLGYKIKDLGNSNNTYTL